MRRLHLTTLLVVLNVGLLLVAVAIVATVAVRLLQQLADEQALARVGQAGVIAHERIDNAGESLATSADLLGERPTLRRLLEQNDTSALVEFLTQFQETSQLDAAAVMANGEVITQTGSSLPWSTIWSEGQEQAAGFLLSPAPGEPLVLASWGSVTALPGHSVGVALRLDEGFSRRLSDEIGLAVTIVDRRSGLADAPERALALRRRALAGTETGATARLDEVGGYVAVVPLREPRGGVVGLVEVRLPTVAVTQSVRQLVTTLVLLALATCGMAGILSFFVGRRLGRPLRSLTRAAARIGRGDLQTPVKLAPSAEIGTLALTLEEMRGRLLHLTDDLRRQQAEAEAIVTGIVEGVYSVDRERRIRYLNPQAAAMLGTTPEAAVGRFCGDVLYPQAAGAARPCAKNCPIVHARFRAGARATEHLVLPGGQRRTVVITSAAPVDELQVQVMRDETEIEATRRLRDGILANISHEFRTPLSAQLASIELLLDTLPELTVDQISQLVRAQQRGSLRLTQLIDNLLESARVEAGQQTIRRQLVAIDEVVEEALELTRPLLDQRQQAVTLRLPYPLPQVWGDGRRLTQVFVNLLGNANKYAPEGSEIKIGACVDAGAVTVWVEDEGPGLPATGGQELFNRFIRSAEDEPEQSGVGLGLWLVKSIVERHGGRVDAESRATGTRMNIVLPLERTHENSDRRR